MPQYTEKDLLKLAKRINNRKRLYLLVDPLQAKHIPVSPSAALQMMAHLGKKASELYGGTKLVIGFAETATAIGGVIARSISEDCSYIHTTRELLAGSQSDILFSEEHSHATEQRLAADGLESRFQETETVIFVDDEFSTGKTLVNMIAQLKARFPVLNEKRMVAASILNRLSAENEKIWEAQGIESVCVLKLQPEDYSRDVAGLNVAPAKKYVFESALDDMDVSVIKGSLPDPRRGVRIGDYFERCANLASMLNDVRDFADKSILVLGTEECMLPALLIGERIEKLGVARSVACHATTRSPIGICRAPGYPIRSGFQIHSFYDPGRETFIYNLASYDAVIVVSDTKAQFRCAFNDLAGIFAELGCRKMICIIGE